MVPFHHQHLIAQIFRGLLLSQGPSEFRDFTYFSFSGLKGQTRVSRQGLQYQSRKTTIVVSSINPEFIAFLTELVLMQETIQIGHLSLSPELAEEEIEMNFDLESKFVCISPIVLRLPDFNSEIGKEFVEPLSDEFSDALYDSTLARMNAYGIQTSEIPDIQKFQVLPDEQYLEKIKEANKKFSRVYPVYDQDVKYDVRGYTFPFRLYAAEPVQQFLLSCGLGEYSHKGFGMLDFANSDPTLRTVSFRTREQLLST